MDMELATTLAALWVLIHVTVLASNDVPTRVWLYDALAFAAAHWVDDGTALRCALCVSITLKTSRAPVAVRCILVATATFAMFMLPVDTVPITLVGTYMVTAPCVPATLLLLCVAVAMTLSFYANHAWTSDKEFFALAASLLANFEPRVVVVEPAYKRVAQHETVVDIPDEEDEEDQFVRV